MLDVGTVSPEAADFDSPFVCTMQRDAVVHHGQTARLLFATRRQVGPGSPRAWGSLFTDTADGHRRLARDSAACSSSFSRASNMYALAHVTHSSNQ